MATEWFYLVESKRCGPVLSAEIKRLAGIGAINPETLIWKEGLSNWISAKSIKGLFPSPEPDMFQFFVESPNDHDRPIIVALPMHSSVFWQKKDQAKVATAIAVIIFIALWGLVILGVSVDSNKTFDEKVKLVLFAPIMIAVLFVGVITYFLPTIIAYRRAHRNLVPILILNLAFAWTFVAWIGLMVWATISTIKIETERSI